MNITETNTYMTGDEFMKKFFCEDEFYYSVSPFIGESFNRIFEDSYKAKQGLASHFGFDEYGRKMKPVRIEKDRASIESDITDWSRHLGVTLHQIIKKYFSLTDMAENKLSKEVVVAEYDDISFQAGTKFTRALSKIMEKMRYPNFRKDDVLTKYSQVLNEKVYQGLLVVSINPVDFYGMSYGSNWTSCLSPGGEYESGTMGYAMDENSVLAFLVSSGYEEAYRTNTMTELVPLKWRKLLIASKEKDAFLTSRGYPFFGLELTDAAIELLWEEKVVRSYYKDHFATTQYSHVGPGYSDITVSSSLICHLYHKASGEFPEGSEFIAGQNYKCIQCGTYEAEDAGHSCWSCSGQELCDDCGEPTYEENLYATESGDQVCECCVDNSYFCVEDSDFLVHENDVVYIESTSCYYSQSYFDEHGASCASCSTLFMFSDEESFAEDDGVFYCSDCVPEEEEEEENED